MRARRRALALSQADLAHRARLGERTVRTAELGEPVATDSAMSLAAILGIPYVVLVRKTASEVYARLTERGYAPLAPPEPWQHRPEGDTLVDAVRGADRGIVLCIEGKSGLGKSALARHLAAECRDAFPDGSLWINAGNLGSDDKVRRLQLDLAGCLGFAELLPEPDLVPAEAFDRAFARRLWARRRLLILDDVKEPEDIERLLDADRPSWLVVTTALRYVAERVHGEHVRLERWDDDAVRSLLAEMVGADRLEADPEGTEELARLTAGVPLVARSVAESLKRRRYTTPSAYARELEQGGIEGLGVEDHAKIGALYVFQDRPFSMAFAREATGLSEVGTRLLLEQLSDLYLLREAPEAEPDETPRPRFLLDSASRGVAFWSTAETQRAMDRLLRAGPSLAREVTGGGQSMAEGNRLDVDLPAWRLLLDEATARVLGPDAGAVETPDAVPEARPGEVLEILPRLLHELSPLLLFRPPPEGGRWITAGVAAARARGDREAQRDLAWLMMMFWWLGRQRVGPANDWLPEATRLAVEVGPARWAISTHVFSAALRAWVEGAEPAIEILELAAALARGAEDCAVERASALTSLASMLLLRGSSERSRSEALLEEALAALDDQQGPLRPVIRGEITLNLAVLRLLRGADLPPAADLAAAVREVLHVFRGSALLEAQVIGLGRLLGIDVGVTPPTAAEAFYAVPPELVHSRILRLGQTAVDLGQPVEGMRYPGAIHTDQGEFSLVTTPLAPREGYIPLAMTAIMPLAPLREMLSGDGLDIALEFLEAARGPTHPHYQALQHLRAGSGTEQSTKSML